MIVLAVMTYNGAAAEPIEASFDELGGTIGRADGNLMVLPDPERTISRVHAKIVHRNGGYAIEDRGSNPILVNGNVVGHGKQWPLSPGDVVQIGGYELGVRASGSPTASADPFADVFGAEPDPLLTAPVAPPAPAPVPPPPPLPAPAAPVAAQAAAPWGRPPVAPPAPARRPMPPAPAASAIPSDWDPLAPDTTAAPRSSSLGLDEHDPGPLLGPAAPEESIDDLFGLGDKAARPAAAWPDDDDFLGIFDPAGPASGGVGEPVVRPRREDARIDHDRHELGVAFPNAVLSAAPMPRPAPPPAPASPAGVRPAAEPRRGAVVSWDDGGARQATIVAPVPAARGAGVMATHVGGTRPGIRTPAPVASPAPVAAPSASAGDADALLRALLEGLATAEAAPPISRLTPELMRLIGSLLAESVRGTVDLLQARASVKREVRAEVTAIRPRQNNPLKFSPTAALALQHLLGPPVPGFMRSEEAMRDAFGDLRAHELAVMAGMRAALAGLLQRFDPKQLETRITARSAIGSLLAGGRRAQLWEAYQQLYSQISAEAEDDFHEVFGRAFLQAYQDQLERLGLDPAAGGA